MYLLSRLSDFERLRETIEQEKALYNPEDYRQLLKMLNKRISQKERF
jgi:hypothetical protein